MIRSISCTLGAAFLLSACATQAPPPVATADGISIQGGQFEFALASGACVRPSSSRPFHGRSIHTRPLT